MDTTRTGAAGQRQAGAAGPAATRGQPASYLWMYPVVLVFAVALLGWGIYLMGVNSADRGVFLAGAVCVVATLLVWFLNINLSAMRRAQWDTLNENIAPVNERLQHLSVLVNQISEQQLISERAKAIAFRETERDALRRAIREEMHQKDWDAALRLVDDMEAAFDYKQEADQLREEINVERESDVRKAITEGKRVIDQHCRTEQWTQALREAERMIRLFPHDPQAQRLPADIEAARQGLKRQLLDSWNDAVARHDVDGSIEILRKLDMYLTPQEGQGLQEKARQVFKDKLLLLGQQFTLAVKDHNWAQAVRLGDTIIADFPNSRMAVEVRERMELLRQRAMEPEGITL